MPHRRCASGGDLFLHFIGQLQQPEHVRDGRPVFADRPRDGILRQPELFAQPPVRVRLLDGIEVLALNVLDQRHLQHLVRVLSPAISRRRPGRAEAGALGGAPAALVG